MRFWLDFLTIWRKIRSKLVVNLKGKLVHLLWKLGVNLGANWGNLGGIIALNLLLQARHTGLMQVESAAQRLATQRIKGFLVVFSRQLRASFTDAMLAALAAAAELRAPARQDVLERTLVKKERRTLRRTPSHAVLCSVGKVQLIPSLAMSCAAGRVCLRCGWQRPKDARPRPYSACKCKHSRSPKALARTQAAAASAACRSFALCQLVLPASDTMIYQSLGPCSACCFVDVRKKDNFQAPLISKTPHDCGRCAWVVTQRRP